MRANETLEQAARRDSRTEECDPAGAVRMTATNNDRQAHRMPHPSAEPPCPDPPDLLRSVFRRHAAGVAVITAHGDRGPVGFTATSLTSVAAQPPLISFGIGTRSSSWPAVSRAEYVGVHILSEHQSDLAATFARSGTDRFALPTHWRRGPQGVPVLDDVLAWLVCHIVQHIPAGDHCIVIAETVSGEATGNSRPLLHHQGRFHTLSDY